MLVCAQIGCGPMVILMDIGQEGGNIPMQLLATEGVTGQLLLQYNWFVFSFLSIVSTNLFDRVGLMQFTNVIG